MNKELKTVQIISNYLQQKNKIPKSVNNIEEIYSFFKGVKTNKKQFNNLYILNYLFNFISSNEVNKRKTSARVFEDLIATIFDGKVADTSKRKNLSYKVPSFFTNVKDKIAGNRREKADILFENYQLSIKTLMETNQEINMGSFEKSVLFDGLNIDNYLAERKGVNNAGLGSKPLLKNLFSVMVALGTKDSWSEFENKFIQMSKFIYADDLIIAIKNDKNMKLYFFKGKEITDIFKLHCTNSENILKIINRWEGNSLRVDRKIFLEKCKRVVEIDFNFLDSSVIEKVNSFDYKLHESYAVFFNENKDIKNEIISSLKSLFDDFEKSFKELK